MHPFFFAQRKVCPGSAKVVSLMLLRRAATVFPFLLCSLLCAQNAAVTNQTYRQAMAQHDYARALELAQADVAARPSDAQAWFERGMALHALHREPDALQSLEKAHTLAPKDLRSAQAAAQVAYQAHDARAAGYVDEVLRLEPESSAAHGMAGVLALEAAHCDVAATHLLRSDVLPVLDPATRVRLAACLQTTQPAQVIALLAPLRTSGALTVDGYSQLASAYSATEQVAAAVELLREGCARFPAQSGLYADLAILSMDHQSPEVAISVLDAGIQANANAADLYTLRGSVYAQLAQNEKATADFEKADWLSPNSAYGALGLGMLLRDGSNLDEAQARLETKLKALPNDPLLSYTLADVLVRQGAAPGDPGFAKAETLLRSALQQDGTLAQAYALLGKLELRQSDVPAATRDLERAVQLNSHDRTALNQLIAAYRRSERTADAARVSEQLARSADEERKRETESNRIHLTLGPAGASKSASPVAAQP